MGQFPIRQMQHDNAVESGYIPERQAANRFHEHEPLIRRDACIRRETFRF